MAVNLPGELQWVLEMLGYDWPPLDEDEMRRAASIMRTFKGDIEGTVRRADAQITQGVGGALSAQTSMSYTKAWDTNSQTNISKLVNALDPAANGVDIAADVVMGLKIKVVAELAITAAQIAAAIASAFFTLGLGAAANVAIIIARKKALEFLTNVAIDQLAQQLLPLIIQPLAEHAVAAVTAMLESDLVEGNVGDVSEFGADLAALEQAAGDLSSTADEQESLAESFISQIQSCQIFVG